VSLTKFDELKKGIVEKVDSCLVKLKDIARRYDPLIPQMDSLNILHNSFRDIEERVVELDSNVTEKMEYIMVKVEELEARPIAIPQPEIEWPHIPNIDENEFEDMKFNVKKMKAEAGNIFDTLEKISGAVNAKVSSEVYDKGIGKKIDRDDVYLLLEKFAMEDDRVKKIQTGIFSFYLKNKRCDYLVQEV
jgi:hypothetical protein